MRKSIKTVAIQSPGDMGHTVGRVLGENGLRVIACLRDRSERTRRLAEAARIEAVPTYEAMVEEADMVLSILVPAQARQAAQTVVIRRDQVRLATPEVRVPDAQ